MSASSKRRTPGTAGEVAATLVCGGFLLVAWLQRGEGYVNASSGLGYRLGIAGASMLLLLTLYSARKRMRALASWGSLRTWFRIHMALGVAGPIAILLHCNFSLGSLNSSIALACMLIVAGSGFAGRFIYSRIHDGLYGRRVRLKDQQMELTEANGKLRPLLQVFPEVMEPLQEFQESAAPRSTIGALPTLMFLRFRTRRVVARCEALLEPVLYEERIAARDYAQLVSGVAAFDCYERLFALWHALHVPLFVMMIISLGVHVVAVHMY